MSAVVTPLFDEASSTFSYVVSDPLTRRCATLDTSALMLPAVQVSRRAGDLPPAEGNGVHYLKVPLNVL